MPPKVSKPLVTKDEIPGWKDRSLFIAWGGGRDLALNKVKFSRSSLCMLLHWSDPPINIWWLSRSPRPMSSFSKQIWVVPLWILLKFSVIPPFGFAVTTDPHFCSPKSQVIYSKILRPPLPHPEDKFMTGPWRLWKMKSLVTIRQIISFWIVLERTTFEARVEFTLKKLWKGLGSPAIDVST